MCKNKLKPPLRHLFHTLITTFLNYLKKSSYNDKFEIFKIHFWRSQPPKYLFLSMLEHNMH